MNEPRALVTGTVGAFVCSANGSFLPPSNTPFDSFNILKGHFRHGISEIRASTILNSLSRARISTYVSCSSHPFPSLPLSFSPHPLDGRG